MRITFKAAGEDEILLGDESARSNCIIGYRAPQERMVQVVPGIRSDYPGIFHRGNRTSEVSFSVSQCHATLEEAHAHRIGYAHTVPDSGELVVSEGNTVVRYANALCKLVDPTADNVNGVSTTTRFVFVVAEYIDTISQNSDPIAQSIS